MRRSTLCVLLAWATAVGLAQWLLLDHSTGAGDPGRPVAHLPATIAADLHWTGERPLLVVAAHPMCPCLPATLGELRRVLQQAAAVDVRVLLYTPPTLPANWRSGAVAAAREQLPRGSEYTDRDGALAKQLGLATSGHVLLFSTDHQLRFSGGITAGRGHVGDNAAVRSLIEALASRAGAAAISTVFGCALVADSTANDRSCCQPLPADRQPAAQ